jgi:hypothetical protein
MTNAPEHLYNVFLTYDVRATGTQLGLFYTVQGDTLVAGAGAVERQLRAERLRGRSTTPSTSACRRSSGSS